MPSSAIEPGLLRRLVSRTDARLARACELAARARRNANAAAEELDAARCELAQLDQALRVGNGERAANTGLMNRNDFARHEHGYTQLTTRRSDACAVLDRTKGHHAAALAALAVANDTQRKLLLQREKYRLAERLLAGMRVEEAVGQSLFPISSIPTMPTMPVPQ